MLSVYIRAYGICGQYMLRHTLYYNILYTTVYMSVYLNGIRYNMVTAASHISLVLMLLF